MFETLTWFRNKYIKLVTYIENHKKVIPLSKYILMYLRVPLLARLILTLMIFAFSHGISYIIGFIILQSKARNEVLSLITAFQNPIEFSNRLYHYYAFVYLFITIATITTFGLYLFYGHYLIFNRLKKGSSSFYLALTIWIVMAFPLLYTMFQLAPLIPYYLFYTSKNSSLWEASIHYFIFSKPFSWFADSMDYGVFQKEIFISLQSGNITVLLLVFFFTKTKAHLKQQKEINKTLLGLFESDLNFNHNTNSLIYMKYNINIFYHKIKSLLSEITSGVMIFIFSFIALVLFVSHTANQLGSFGKSLTQFDTDTVKVNYVMNDQNLSVEGIRIYQDKNYIVIRDKDNQIINIFTDQISIQTTTPEKEIFSE